MSEQSNYRVSVKLRNIDLSDICLKMPWIRSTDKRYLSAHTNLCRFDVYVKMKDNNSNTAERKKKLIDKANEILKALHSLSVYMVRSIQNAKCTLKAILVMYTCHANVQIQIRFPIQCFDWIWCLSASAFCMLKFLISLIICFFVCFQVENRNTHAQTMTHILPMWISRRLIECNLARVFEHIFLHAYFMKLILLKDYIGMGCTWSEKCRTIHL